jgi:hypothetical protein
MRVDLARWQVGSRTVSGRRLKPQRAEKINHSHLRARGGCAPIADIRGLQPSLIARFQSGFAEPLFLGHDEAILA